MLNKSEIGFSLDFEENLCETCDCECTSKIELYSFGLHAKFIFLSLFIAIITIKHLRNLISLVCFFTCKDQFYSEIKGWEMPRMSWLAWLIVKSRY